MDRGNAANRMIVRPFVALTSFLVLLCNAIAPLLALGPSQNAPGSTTQPSSHSSFLSRYCVSCHNASSMTAGLALDTLDPEDLSGHAETWEKVVRKLRTRTMPPIGRLRPDEASYDMFASYLETSLDRMAAADPDPGRTETFQRLNRAEYRNSIRELLALDVDVESLLPNDETNYGFDNVGVGGLSPMLMERYMLAADRISRLAVGSSVGSPGGTTFVLPPELTQEDRIDGLPYGTRGGGMVSHNFPLDAEYEVQIQLKRNFNDDILGLSDEQYYIDVMLDGRRVELFTLGGATRGGVVDEDERVDDDTFRTRISVKAGSHTVGVAFLKRPSARLETQRQPYLSSFGAAGRHGETQPAVDSFSILGPFDSAGPGDTASRRRIFVCRPAGMSDESACAKTIISALARRAYRRPVTDVDLQMPLNFFEQARTKGGFEAGIELALRALLVSPQFLFRVELDPPGVASNTAYQLNDIDLASRLSFFLWSSLPDEELLDLAASGALSEPEVINGQVERMLADPRAEALVDNFAGQWLYLRNLVEAHPDPRLYPDFDENLRLAFRRETELFFESIITEDRSVLDLLAADYTFVNERLAKHYGIPNVYGSHFRRLTLGRDNVRGGLLGQGSILTVTSYGTRTSPVLRGKWILENIVGMPPPPPPPNVPPLDEEASARQVLSMRERMVQHRANPVCASCHRLMDPIGLAVENFDAVGQWRTSEAAGTSIDASGGLPDGSTFDGVAGLRQALLDRPELFVGTVTEKLLTYALGRGLGQSDAPAVRTILRDARSNDYRFSSLVVGIVNSVPFQMRRSQ